MKALQILTMIIGIHFSDYKIVVKIVDCANSGRCRVIFDDNSTDLVFNPFIGMKVVK